MKARVIIVCYIALLCVMISMLSGCLIVVPLGLMGTAKLGHMEYQRTHPRVERDPCLYCYEGMTCRPACGYGGEDE
jgi:hypothetical protein